MQGAPSAAGRCEDQVGAVEDFLEVLRTQAPEAFGAQVDLQQPIEVGELRGVVEHPSETCTLVDAEPPHVEQLQAHRFPTKVLTHDSGVDHELHDPSTRLPTEFLIKDDAAEAGVTERVSGQQSRDPIPRQRVRSKLPLRHWSEIHCAPCFEGFDRNRRLHSWP
ncbi:protein of unknown function [Nocardia cyriacigeorgica GUH-2]|uniref:Uncharacterized protein n=1 Tax=Nocardia cyriacigeorgica (strain GUH-2) TaxID=1127134 RepID=H6QYZ2_NOCCG|nr:protein of unknown function [Nocardia cyriacigeorgica GUH-2]